MFVCDIASFGSADRDDHARAYLRKVLYDGLRASFDAAGVPYDHCYREDRGDGVMLIVPPSYDTAVLISSVVDGLRGEVRRHNDLASSAASLQVRVAVHIGACVSDDHGLVGDALNHAFRILEAAPLKRALRDSGAGVGLVVSQRVYEDVVRHGPGLVDPGEYVSITVEVKETAGAAWIRVPGAAPGPEFQVPGDAVFQLVDRLLEIPLMRQERGRDQVVDALPFGISVVIPRSPEARFDVHGIVRTCLDYPGGLHRLIAVIRGFVGDSIPMYELERSLRA
jgi:hypothetical protein